MVMKEYVGNPKATAEALDENGWLDTGDLAMRDENGWLSIQDRAKDMIIRGGENVGNLDIECLLMI
jgi:long-subunit acyl-CoA synthetase (AMP-forming)